MKDGDQKLGGTAPFSGDAFAGDRCVAGDAISLPK
jgi:hypothetical protein